jgi:hypothetical protein
MLEDHVPAETVRLIESSEDSLWPAIRALLEAWTNYFRYRRNNPMATLALDVPKITLALSLVFERYLAVNLPRALIERFVPKVTSGEEQPAFHRLTLQAFRELLEATKPPRYVKSI